MKTPSPSLQVGVGGVVAPKAELEVKAPKTELNLGLHAPKAEVDVRAPKTELNLNLGLHAPSVSADAGAGAGVEMRAPPLAVGAELSAPSVSAPAVGVNVDLGAGAGAGVGVGANVGAGVGADLNVGADEKRLSLQRMGAVATPFAGLGGGVQLRKTDKSRLGLGLDTHLSGIPEGGAGLHVSAAAPAPHAGLDVTVPKPAFSADIGGAGLGTGAGGHVGLGGVGFGGGVGMPSPSAHVEMEGPVPKARMSRLLNKPDVSMGVGLNVKAPTLVRVTSSNFLLQYNNSTTYSGHFSESFPHLHQTCELMRVAQLVLLINNFKFNGSW